MFSSVIDRPARHGLLAMIRHRVPVFRGPYAIRVGGYWRNSRGNVPSEPRHQA